MRIEDNAVGIGHIGIPTHNLRATVAFYENLGYSKVHVAKTPDGANVVFLRLKDIMIEAYESVECVQKAGGIDHIAISVADIDDAFKQMQQKGMKVLDDEVQFLPFFEEGVRFFTIEGPNAEKIEYCQRV